MRREVSLLEHVVVSLGDDAAAVGPHEALSRLLRPSHQSGSGAEARQDEGLEDRHPSSYDPKESHTMNVEFHSYIPGLTSKLFERDVRLLPAKGERIVWTCAPGPNNDHGMRRYVVIDVMHLYEDREELRGQPGYGDRVLVTLKPE
jgi:hypothetical protein